MELDNQVSQSTYDPRWFIWTIVFLVCTGVMLVTYITTSNANEDAVISSATATIHHKTIPK